MKGQCLGSVPSQPPILESVVSDDDSKPQVLTWLHEPLHSNSAELVDWLFWV